MRSDDLDGFDQIVTDDPRKLRSLLRDNRDTWTRFLLAIAVGALIGFVLGSVIAAVIA